MKDEEQIVIDGIPYECNEYYKRLNILSSHCELTNSHVRCPKCRGNLFSIKYGYYECIAVCSCGHEMTVYDG